MSYEQPNGAEFVSFARNFALADGLVTTAAMLADNDRRTPIRVKSVLQSGMVGGSDDPAWGSQITDYRIMVSSFMNTLRSISIFDRVLSDGMRKLPMRVRILSSTTGVTGSVVGEGKVIPVSKLNIGVSGVSERKAAALLVVSKELLRHSVEGGEAFLAAELRKGVANATDGEFVRVMLEGAPSGTVTGSGAIAVRNAVNWLMAQMPITALSRLFVFGSADLARKIATLTTADGMPIFPGMSPLGGELYGMTFLTTDHLANDELVMIDANEFGGGSETITLDVSDEATVSLAMAGDELTVRNVASMFQENLMGLRALRWFGVDKLNDKAAAKVTGLTLE